MKITIENKEPIEIKVGDFLLVHDSGQEPELRQIIEFRDLYVGIDVETGESGFAEDSIEELYKEYIDNYDNVRIVKNSDVEMIIGGR